MIFRIDKIDPPSWFIGMNERTLQLFIYGEGLKDFRTTADFGKTETVIYGGTFAIVTILLYSNSNEGEHEISFEKGEVKICKLYWLKRKKNRCLSCLSPADSIYLIMPDRFAKGKDTKAIKDLKPKDPNGWHGGKINGIREHLDYIEDLGVTTIWLTPIFKNNKKAYKGKFYSYHGYAITDFYDIDEHFGTIDDYRLLVKESHEKGLKVIMDVVFNHCGSEHPWNNGTSPRSWINRNPMKSNYECTTIFGSYTSKYDKEQTVKGWFADTMPDLNLKNDDVLRYLTQMTCWWIETTGIDAFRMDTYLYSDNRQMNKWLRKLNNEYPEFPVIAETWVGNPAYTSRVQKSALKSTGKGNPLIVMDFAFQEKISEAIRKKDLKIIYNHFVYDFLYENAYQTLAFLDNHDMIRWARKHTDVADMKIALTILLTMPRIPQIFYGTELMFSGIGDGKGDGKIREDFCLNKSLKELIVSYSNDNRYEVLEYLKKLLCWRRGSLAIKYGDMVQFLPEEGVYVYFRKTEKEKIMCIFNPTKNKTSMSMERYYSELKKYKRGINIMTEKTMILNRKKIINLDKKEVLILKIV